MESYIEWSRVAIKYATLYARTKKCPSKTNIAQKSYSIICFPLCCGTCCIWSTAFRLIACPFQCILRGPQAICTKNECTSISDACISSCVNEIYGNLDVPILCKHSGPLSQMDIDALIKVVDVLIDIYPQASSVWEKTTDEYHYKIIDKVVLQLTGLPKIELDANTIKNIVPSNVHSTLTIIKQKLERLERLERLENHEMQCVLGVRR